jgi:receptor-type tyrosine-protein phosphatase gamma
MLKQIEHRKMLNIFGFLRHIRTQRNFLVQTEEQYIFLHDALVEAIASCETNLTLDQIAARGMDDDYLRNQFELITSWQPKEIHMTSATKQVNQVKNRMILPLEGSRAHLTPKPGMDGTDYINASWLFGFRRLRDFIISQHPLSNTIKDFWQMIMDHQVQTIVCLSTVDDVVSLKHVLNFELYLIFIITFFSRSFSSGRMRMKQSKTNIIDCSCRQWKTMSNTTTSLSTSEFNRFKRIPK